MKISTVIPFYNDAANLKKCLESLRNADPAPCEIIIIDDFSSQDITEILKDYSFIKLIRLERRRGAGFARSIGINAANGDVVAFLDSDCFVRKDWFALIHKNLTKEIAGIIGGYRLANKDKFSAVYEFFDIGYCQNSNKGDGAETSFIIGGCCAFWTDVLLEMDLKNTFLFDKFAAGEDTILGLELKKQRRAIKIHDFKAYHHFSANWERYFYKQIIRGFSVTVISALYKKDTFGERRIKLSYIILQLVLTVSILLFFVDFLVTKKHFVALVSSIFMFVISEAGFIKYIFSFKEARKSRIILLALIRPFFSFLRNIFWILGMAGGIFYLIEKKYETSRRRIFKELFFAK